MTREADDQRSPVSRSAGFGHTLKTVAWSFIGIRRRSGLEEDFQKVNPLHVMAVAVVAVLLFIVGLAVFVNWVVSRPVGG
ncbi:MAG: hypothetical protein Fur0019_01950 [Tibeticola sp.]